MQCCWGSWNCSCPRNADAKRQARAAPSERGAAASTKRRIADRSSTGTGGLNSALARTVPCAAAAGAAGERGSSTDEAF